MTNDPGKKLKKGTIIGMPTRRLPRRPGSAQDVPIAGKPPEAPSPSKLDPPKSAPAKREIPNPLEDGDERIQEALREALVSGPPSNHKPIDSITSALKDPVVAPPAPTGNAASAIAKGAGTRKEAKGPHPDVILSDRPDDKRNPSEGAPKGGLFQRWRGKGKKTSSASTKEAPKADAPEATAAAADPNKPGITEAAPTAPRRKHSVLRASLLGMGLGLIVLAALAAILFTTGILREP
ncbi:MAG: hypothetical protein KC416_15650, partial [Myxococcales bacterium]|nr:hypothetical protein [Myxococcales bacterium]